MSSKVSTTGSIGDIQTFLLVTEVAAPLYIVCLLVPSLLFNGAVILVFLTKKEIRSPFNLLTINQCCAGIVSNLLNGVLFLVVDPIELKRGTCRLETVLLGTVVWFHYGVYMINMAAVSTCMYFTLRYGSSFITYKKIVPVIGIVWLYPALWAALLSYSVRNITSVRCQTFTETEPTTSNSSSYSYSVDQVLPFVMRDVMIDVVARVMVAVFSVASYRRFRRNTINPTARLTRRMLLLPILMTSLLTFLSLSTGVLLIGLNGGYGVVVTPHEYENSSLLYIQEITQLAVEFDAIVYVLLLIYFNNNMRSALKGLLSQLFHYCRHQFRVKSSAVSPNPIPHQEVAPTHPITAWEN